MRESFQKKPGIIFSSFYFFHFRVLGLSFQKTSFPEKEFPGKQFSGYRVSLFLLSGKQFFRKAISYLFETTFCSGKAISYLFVSFLGNSFLGRPFRIFSKQLFGRLHFAAQKKKRLLLVQTEQV